MEAAGKSAIVAGGGSGLGPAVTQRLHAAGAFVVVVDRPGSEGSGLVSQLGERVVFVPAEMTDEYQTAAAIDRAVEAGRFAIVVNCTGLSAAPQDTEAVEVSSLARFRDALEVGLVSTYNVVRLSCAAMMGGELEGEERGVVINTASVAAFDGQPGQDAFAASMGGVVAMTLPLARSLAGDRIRVVSIAPDPARQEADAQAFADLVLHVVENPMLNGETIRLDGPVRLAS